MVFLLVADYFYLSVFFRIDQLIIADEFLAMAAGVDSLVYIDRYKPSDPRRSRCLRSLFTHGILHNADTGYASLYLKPR